MAKATYIKYFYDVLSYLAESNIAGWMDISGEGQKV